MRTLTRMQMQMQTPMLMLTQMLKLILKQMPEQIHIQMQMQIQILTPTHKQTRVQHFTLQLNRILIYQTQNHFLLCQVVHLKSNYHLCSMDSFLVILTCIMIQLLVEVSLKFHLNNHILHLKVHKNLIFKAHKQQIMMVFEK